VDRLWPRGLSKAAAQIDEWAKDAAPSPGLRQAWHADPHGREPAHFAQFAAHYRAELATPTGLGAVRRLAGLAATADRLTLVYGARDEQVNHALVLADAVRAQLAARAD
jgi:uncharacterized protein YeaO (DUF488 family)